VGGTHTIVTTTPNSPTAPIRRRMPVIPESRYEEIRPGPELADPNFPFLKPYPAAAVQPVPVSPAVNTVTANNAALMAPGNSQ